MVAEASRSSSGRSSSCAARIAASACASLRGTTVSTIPAAATFLDRRSLTKPRLTISTSKSTASARARAAVRRSAAARGGCTRAVLATTTFGRSDGRSTLLVPAPGRTRLVTVRCQVNDSARRLPASPRRCARPGSAASRSIAAAIASGVGSVDETGQAVLDELGGAASSPGR